MRRWLSILAVLCGACVWPRVNCPEGTKVSAADQLDVIDRIAKLDLGKGKIDKDLYARIRAATYACRNRWHPDELGDKLHCDFVLAAVRWTARRDWEKVLLNLEHGTDPRSPVLPEKYASADEVYKDDPRPKPLNLEWVNTMCDGMLVGEMLQLIDDLAMACPEPPQKQIHDLTATCRNHPRQWPPPPPMMTMADHCSAVWAAYNAAIGFDWVSCVDELDHGPS